MEMKVAEPLFALVSSVLVGWLLWPLAHPQDPPTPPKYGWSYRSEFLVEGEKFKADTHLGPSWSVRARRDLGTPDRGYVWYFERHPWTIDPIREDGEVAGYRASFVVGGTIFAGTAKDPIQATRAALKKAQCLHAARANRIDYAQAGAER